MNQVDQNGTPVLIDEDTGEVLATAFFKTPYNHDRDAESDRTGLVCLDKSLTDQSFKEEVDINTIVDRIRRTGEVPITLPEHFGDGTNIPTLFDARMRIAENNATFYKLPPEIREEFLNDPGRWESQVMKDLDAGNLDNLARMGVDIRDLPVYGYKPPAAPQEGSPAPGAPGPAPAPSGASAPASGPSGAK